MKQSRLHDQHQQLGATFEEVTGWSVPAQYGDATAEHAAARNAVGISDLSHRGKMRVTGDDRIKWLQSIISNDILLFRQFWLLLLSLLGLLLLLLLR